MYRSQIYPPFGTIDGFSHKGHKDKKKQVQPINDGRILQKGSKVEPWKQKNNKPAKNYVKKLFEKQSRCLPRVGGTINTEKSHHRNEKHTKEDYWISSIKSFHSLDT